MILDGGEGCRVLLVCGESIHLLITIALPRVVRLLIHAVELVVCAVRWKLISWDVSLLLLLTAYLPDS